MPPNVTTLQPTACLGFNGAVRNGLNAVEYDDEPFVCYPLGAMVVVQHATKRDGVCFLRGHTEDVTCLQASHDGRMLCTGQHAALGIASPCMLWDLEDACDRILRPRKADAAPPAPLKVLQQHMSGVKCVGFNCDDSLLFTMGARDDNKLCLWEVPSGEPKVSVPAALDTAFCGAFLRDDPYRLVTGGKHHVKVWRIDPESYRMHAMDAKVGTMVHIIDCVAISGCDNYALCGTRSGEVLQVNINRDPIKDYNDPDAVVPRLENISRGRHAGGVQSICVLPEAATESDVVCAGAGDGSLTLYSPDLRQFKRWACSVEGPVTSLSATSNEGKLSGFAVGTSTGNRYTLAVGGSPKLRGTSHVGAVFDVCYPAYSSRVFATCAVEDIRVWDAKTKSELVRIRVPNLECRTIAITAAGDTLVSGWSDGKVRAFGPETGKMKWVMADAHDLNNNGGPMDCTSVEVVKEGGAEEPQSGEPWRLLTGGVDGRVRVWRVTQQHRAMLSSTKEHRGAITALKVTSDLRNFISASTDGNCLVWDLQTYVRKANLFEATCYRACFYHPDCSQIVTTGANCKITFWAAVGYDGSAEALREAVGGPAEMTALACSQTGNHFVSGSRDSTLKLWDYDAGIHVAEGTAHSGAINAMAIAPNQKVCVTAGGEGGIMLWPLPDEVGADEQAV